jgi:hypothetical protein
VYDRFSVDDECIAAGLDLWFGGTGIPYPADACQGREKGREAVPPIAAQVPVQVLAQAPPEAGGVILLRSAPKHGLRSSSTVEVKIRNGEQNGR